MSWLTKVEDLVGAVSDTTAVTQWLQDGAWDIIRRVKKINPGMLPMFASISENVGDSASIENNLLLGVYRTNVETEAEYREVPASFKYKAVDSDSLYNASTSDPVFYRENGSIYMLPAGGNNDISLVAIDTTNLVHGGTSVDYFPEDMEYLIVLYTALQGLQRKMNDDMISVTVVAPDVPTISEVSYTEATETDIASVTAAVVTAITFPSSDAPSYTAPVAPILGEAIAFQEYWTLSDFGDSDPGTLTIVASAPVAPTIASYDIGYTSFDDDAVVTILTEISTEDNVFDIEDWEDAYDEDDLDKAKEALSMYSHRLKEAQGVFDAEMDVAKETISALIEKAKHEDDTFVQAELTKYQAELTEYQQKVTKEISEYQAKLERYKLELTTVFQAWQNTEAVKVQSYQAELQSYQAEIQNATNEFNEDNANFQAKVQASIQNAQASNQIALQNLQKDLARAQADAQSDSARKLQDAIQTTQALMADNNNILQKFQMEISQYQAEVTSATQESQLKTQQYQMQYVQLKQQYEQGFVPFQVQQEAKQ